MRVRTGQQYIFKVRFGSGEVRLVSNAHLVRRAFLLAIKLRVHGVDAVAVGQAGSARTLGINP